LWPDPEHSEEEDRFVLLGMSTSLGILLVCHCYREAESVIRVISARKADADEQRLRKPKKQLTNRLDEDTIEYFRALAEKNGIPYQNLINLYLRDCAQSHRKLSMKWE
jgi:uncharacterized protein (DUF4415 family)